MRQNSAQPEGGSSPAVVRTALGYCFAVMSSTAGVTIASMFVAAVLRRALTLVGTGATGSGLQFYFSHMTALQSACGLIGGYLWALLYRGRSAVWAWVLPTLIVGLQVARFSVEQSSVLETPWRTVWFHYLGGACSPAAISTIQDVGRGCLDQLEITNQLFSSIAFSIGAFVNLKSGRPSEFLRKVFPR